MPGFAPLLMATLAFGVLAFGAVYPWAYWLVAVASAELGLWAILLGRAWNDWRLWRLALVLAAVAVAIGLQLVPLPPSVFAIVSPNAHQVLSEFEVGYALRQPGWHPITLSEWDTVVALALFVAFALLLVGTTRAFRYENLLTFVSQLTLLALVVALVGIVQHVAASPGEQLIYFFWRPQYQGEGFGPFVNRNHFAGWAAMVLPLIAARVVATSEVIGGFGGPIGATWRRWLASPEAGRAAFTLMVVLVLGIAVVLSRSRSGIGSVAVAIAVLGLFVARRAGKARTRFAMLLGLPLLLAGAMAWAGYDVAMARFERVPTEIAHRVSAWRDTIRIAGDFPIAGVGVGGYATAMAVYQTAPRHALFVQAHNDYLQVMAEGGMLVGLPALAAVLLVLHGIWRRFRAREDEAGRYWLRAGAVAGLAAIAAQSLVEFSLQKPGNAVLFVVLIAIALHRPSRGHDLNAHRI